LGDAAGESAMCQRPGVSEDAAAGGEVLAVRGVSAAIAEAMSEGEAPVLQRGGEPGVLSWREASGKRPFRGAWPRLLGRPAGPTAPVAGGRGVGRPGVLAGGAGVGEPSAGLPRGESGETKA
jgi:hypothetical protein